MYQQNQVQVGTLNHSACTSAWPWQLNSREVNGLLLFRNLSEGRQAFMGSLKSQAFNCLAQRWKRERLGVCSLLLIQEPYLPAHRPMSSLIPTNPLRRKKRQAKVELYWLKCTKIAASNHKSILLGVDGSGLVRLNLFSKFSISSVSVCWTLMTKVLKITLFV